MATTEFIRYSSDYKYQLADTYEIKIIITPKDDIDVDFIGLTAGGTLLIKKGYAWDGPSGPIKDTEENMRASLVHDALYQLMRMEELSTRSHRKAADQLFKDICKEMAYPISALRPTIRPYVNLVNRPPAHRAKKSYTLRQNHKSNKHSLTLVYMPHC